MLSRVCRKCGWIISVKEHTYFEGISANKVHPILQMCVLQFWLTNIEKKMKHVDA